MAPVVVREGKPVEIEPLSPGGEVDFGEPIGEAETIYTLHSELRTFRDSFGCREASFRLSLAPALLGASRDLIGSPDEEVERPRAEAKPASPKTISVHVVEASSDGRSARVTAPDPSARELGPGRRRRVHGVAGGSSGAPARAGQIECPGRAAARALRRA